MVCLLRLALWFSKGFWFLTLMVTALCCFFSGWLASLVSFYKYLIYVSEASLDVPPSHVSHNGFLHFYLMECLVNKGENEWHKFMFAGGAIFS